MAGDSDAIKNNYNENLKAKDYSEEFNRVLPLFRGNFEFMLQFLNDVIKSGRFEGSKLLEVGSGATVHNIAAASSRYSCIVQSDYVEDNCEELKKWMQGQSTLDWTRFLDLVLEIDAKEKSPIITRSELEARIRSTVKCVVRGDLLSDQVLLLEELSPETLPPYDLIITVLCIGAVAKDYDTYVAILRRINSLLRSGGGLVVCGYEKGSPWKSGESTFHYLSLTMRQITEAFEMSGFGICDVKTYLKPESEDVYDYSKLFCIAAEKQ